MKCTTLMLSFAIVFSLLIVAPRGQASEIQRNEVFSYDDALTPPTATRGHLSPVAGASPIPGYFDLTEYLMGSVAVGVVLLESDGSIDTETEDWDPLRQGEVRTEIEAGITWWAMQDYRAGLSFVFEYHMSVPTGHEPISHSGWTDEGQWIRDAMSYLGYNNASYFDSVSAWANDLRTAHATDWAFVIFVVDSLNDPDGAFASGYSAYAYLGGPFFIMTYDNDGYGIFNMDFVAAHEMGHTFYATDEYNGDPEYSGYLNVLDNEYSGCIMHQALSWCISNGTLGQIGWQDTDGDDIFDILDVPPETTLASYLPDPTNNQTPAYDGYANVVAYPNRNPFGPGNNITISRISGVDYAVNSWPWQPGLATDGSFDEVNETYHFTTFPLGNGMHQVIARAVNTEGNVDTTPATDMLTVDVDKPDSAVTSFPSIVNWTTLALPADAFDNLALAEVELWYSYEGGPYFFVISDGAMPWLWDFDTAAFNGDGNYSFYTVAVDVVGNREDPPIGPDVRVLVDTVTPWSSAIQPAPMTNQSTFQINATAGDRGLLQTVEMHYRCGGSGWTLLGDLSSPPWSWIVDAISLCGDGTYDFHTIARDTAGNAETVPLTPDATVIVDTRPPSSTLEPLPSYVNQSTFVVTAVPLDVNGISSVDIWFDFESTGKVLLASLDLPPWTALVDSDLLGGDGRYDFYVRATDSAGNVEQIHSLHDTTTIVDTTPPTAALAALQQYTRAMEFTVSATAQDANGVVLVELWFRKDAGAWTLFSASSSPPWTWRFNITSLGEGTYEFLSTSVDAAGNEETWDSVPEAVTIVDLTAPDIRFTAPNAGVWITSVPFTIRWSGTDNVSGIGQYRLDFAGNSSTVAASITQLLVDSTDDGVRQAVLAAWDNAGNCAVVQLTISVDTTAPELTIGSPAEGGTVYDRVMVNWTGSDLTSGLDRFEYSVDGGGFVDVGLMNNESLGLGLGAHHLVVRAYDVAGNVREAGRTFTVVEPPSQAESLTVLLLAIVVVVAVLTILLLVVFNRRKKKDEEKPPPPPPPDA